ncbi:hypothetical protein [Kosakonia quasisacchari]
MSEAIKLLNGKWGLDLSRVLAGPWCASLLPGARCVAPDVLMTKRHASRG